MSMSMKALSSANAASKSSARAASSTTVKMTAAIGTEKYAASSSCRNTTAMYSGGGAVDLHSSSSLFLRSLLLATLGPLSLAGLRFPCLPVAAAAGRSCGLGCR
eukprot:3540462-Rhodomonas_salina.2